MEAASQAINKLIANAGSKKSKTEEPEASAPASASVAPEAIDADVDEATVGQKDTTVTQEVAPAVEHEHVKKLHETQEQTVVDRERHQDHYHTTVQPLKDQEVEATKHDQVTADTIEREVNNDEDAEKVRAKAEADRAAFKSTSEEERQEKTTIEDTVVGEQVHHHVHETIQPVIEKEVIKPSVTHKVIPVHEVVHEKSKYEGVTTNAPISVSEFTQPLDGSSTVERKHDGTPVISEKTGAATLKDDN